MGFFSGLCLGNLCAKTARNAARFSLLFFRVGFFLLIGCFLKSSSCLRVLYGEFCLMNGLFSKHFVTALFYLETARNAARFFLFVFLGICVALIGSF